MADPYAVYRRLRESAPVLTLEREDGVEVVVTGYEPVRQLLRDERVSADRAHATRLRAMLAAAPPELSPEPARASMLVRDDPAHARLRGLVSQAFSPRSVATLEPRIRALAEALLDASARDAGFDAVTDFAEPLATLVIAERLGVDGADHERFRGWSRALLAGLLGDGPAGPEAVRARRALDGYWHALIRARHAEPRDDLASELVAAREVDGLLSDGELLAMLDLILVAGHETSASLIASALWALLRESERRVLDDAALGNLVEEALRWQSPIQCVGRAVVAEIELCGRRLPPGAALTLVLGAANRDPAVFDEPDRFAPERENAKLHLAFGSGDHFCLGAALARSEARLALGVALERLPRHRLAEAAPRWRHTALMRGLARLPLQRF